MQSNTRKAEVSTKSHTFTPQVDRKGRPTLSFWVSRTPEAIEAALPPQEPEDPRFGLVSEAPEGWKRPSR